MLAALPEDLAFTKLQDDIEDPAEFDFDYLLGITRLRTLREKDKETVYKAEDKVI